MSNKLKVFLTSNDWNATSKAVVIVFIIIAFFSLIAVNFLEPAAVFGIDAAILVLILFLRFPLVGFYAMVGTFPFVGWQIQVASLSAPVVDVIALFVLAAVVLRYIVHLPLTKNEFSLKNFPGLFFALFFFGACALSLAQNQTGVLFFPALKYLLRPIVFFYLMFILLPYHIIRDKQVFLRTLKIMLGVGLFVAFLGLLSVMFSNGPWYDHRAVPFSIGDVNMLGGNQNAVAEVLVVAIPVAFLLMREAQKIKERGWYLLAVIFMVVILLLTFSRSGWLALLVELSILFFINYRHKVDRYALMAFGFLLVSVPLLFYFLVWNQVDWVQSSNSSRLAMISISWHYFQQSPWIGQGLNTFQSLLGNTFAYVVDFGDPLDSHGFVQKMGVESGILGLIGFLSLLVYVFYTYIRSYTRAHAGHARAVILCLFLMASGIVFFELFSTSYYLATMWLPLGVGLAGLRFYS